MLPFSPTKSEVERQAAKVALQKELAEFQAELVELELQRAGGKSREDLKETLEKGRQKHIIKQLESRVKEFEKQYGGADDIKPSIAEIQDQWKSLKEFAEPKKKGVAPSRRLKSPEELAKEVKRLEGEAKRNAAAEPLIAVAKCPLEKRHEMAHAGPCPKCHKLHALPRTQEAIDAVDKVHKGLKKEIGGEGAGTESLGDTAKAQMKDGKMIGVLLCQDDQGKPVELRAFSGVVEGLKPGQDFWCVEDPDYETLKSLNGNERDLTEDDQLDNRPGNCAAQKLLRFVADYPESEKKRRQAVAKVIKEKKQLLENRLKSLGSLKDYLKEFENTDLPDPENFVRDEVDDAFSKIGSPRRTDPVNELNTDQKKVKDFVEARLNSAIKALDQKVKAVLDAPLAKQLKPVGMAEMWIGEGKEGDIPKTDGFLYDSCLTCRNTLGEVMCTNTD